MNAAASRRMAPWRMTWSGGWRDLRVRRVAGGGAARRVARRPRHPRRAADRRRQRDHASRASTLQVRPRPTWTTVPVVSRPRFCGMHAAGSRPAASRGRSCSV